MKILKAIKKNFAITNWDSVCMVIEAIIGVNKN